MSSLADVIKKQALVISQKNQVSGHKHKQTLLQFFPQIFLNLFVPYGGNMIFYYILQAISEQNNIVSQRDKMIKVEMERSNMRVQCAATQGAGEYGEGGEEQGGVA